MVAGVGAALGILGLVVALAHICREIMSVFALSRLRGSLWAVSNVQLGTFSDTLLVVSILDRVYECHLQMVLQS